MVKNVKEVLVQVGGKKSKNEIRVRNTENETIGKEPITHNSKKTKRLLKDNEVFIVTTLKKVPNLKKYTKNYS